MSRVSPDLAATVVPTTAFAAILAAQAVAVLSEAATDLDDTVAAVVAIKVELAAIRVALAELNIIVA